MLEGSFEIVLGENVVDRETGTTITLDQLLRQFLEDPDETGTGRIRITIEPAQFPASDLPPWIDYSERGPAGRDIHGPDMPH